MKNETKIGLMFIATFSLVVGFAYFLGAVNPFATSKNLHLAYNFAGGIEVGSPVRVMGIKVGKVRAIQFMPDLKAPNGEETKLRITISVDRSAWNTIREDSQFFINLAGVIGEKFIEITPGSLGSPQLKEGGLYRGEDPPRIDQLISQSYGLAGKIVDFIEGNETTVVDTINMMNKLVDNLNQALKLLNKTTGDKQMAEFLRNLMTLTSDMAFLSQKLRGPEGEKNLKLLNDLLWRLEPLDGPAIRKFLQDEGIKAKLF